MSRQKFEKTFNTFTKGLMTEASELNFPEDFSLYEKNFLLHRDGGRDRRKGMELIYPLGLTLTSGLYPLEFGDSLQGGTEPPRVRETPTALSRDEMSAGTLPPTAKIRSTVRYLEYLRWVPESMSGGTLPPTATITTLVRYLEYKNWSPGEVGMGTLPPTAIIETTVGRLLYDRHGPEVIYGATLPPIVQLTTM